MIGCPVEHSLSPAIHNAGFAALGLDWEYLAVAVPDGRAARAVAAMRSLGLIGMSVTMPHKAAVVAAVDRLTPRAARLGAVNTVLRDGDRLVGDSTDGVGLLDALAEHDWHPDGRRVVVLGAGGAARAAVAALGDAGAEVVVVNRTLGRGEAAARLAGPSGRTGTPAAAADADLILNATPVGMGGDAGLPLDPALLGAGQLVLDMIYDPAATPFLLAAANAGATAVGGLTMLVHQAAHAFSGWTGAAAPVDAMREAAEAELARRAG